VAEISVPPSPALGREFRVGRVIERAAQLYQRNFLTFSLVSLIALLPAQLVVENPLTESRSASAGAKGTIFVLSIVLSMLSQAVIVHAAFQDMRGRPVRLLDSAGVAMSRSLPVLGLSILSGLGATIGILLFVIPGLIAYTMWFVAVPCCVVEQHGPMDSLQRSTELTRGVRWQIFGIWFVVIVGATLIDMVIENFTVATGSFAIWFVAAVAWSTIWGAIFTLLAVVSYYELRSVKEGVDIEQIASVFD